MHVYMVLKGHDPCTWLKQTSTCTHTLGIGVQCSPQENTSATYLFIYLFFNLKAKLPYGYFKTEFGIGLRDKQKLNLEGGAKSKWAYGGSTYVQGKIKTLV